MDVGLELRQARERRGLSLLQLSQITKISPRVLEAIEASDEEHLPAPVFTRSFVKTYAAEVRLDPNDTLGRYLEQFEPLDAPAPAAAVAEPETMPDDERPRGPARVLLGRFGNAIVLILVGLAAATLATRNYREAQREAMASEPAADSSAALAASVPPPSQPQAVGTSGAAAAPLDALNLTIAPSGPCWVQATVNGAPVLAALLTVGDRRSLQTADGITLRVGDPATFAFSINGKPAKVTGTPGQAVTVQITRENYARFLVRL